MTQVLLSTRSITIVALLIGFFLTSAHASTEYVFATFTGDDSAGEKLSIYISPDALNFTLLKDTHWGGQTGTLRDPSIMKHSDGKYYLVYTSPPYNDGYGKQAFCAIGVSADLITWKNLTTVSTAGISGVAHTWAPEWFIDGGTVKFIVHCDTKNTDSDFRPYVFTATNSALTAWSGPIDMGIGINYIDGDVVKSGGTYHCFIKNETTRYLEHATAPSLIGPWTWVGSGNWANWGSGLEGPSIVKLPGGAWRMYVDPQAGGVPYKYMNSPDLNSWSAMITLPGSPASVVRHGTILRDTTYGITSIGSHDARAPLLRNSVPRTGIMILTNGRFDQANGGLQDALETENPVVYYRLDGRKLPVFPGVFSSGPYAAKGK
jgi:Glycosyl hydrolases family 43